ncbi:MAG TPA: hypothetical protein VGZ93_07760 [Candidatus Methylacidiphilales bacterium]|nr:hypothetical protein [Candidatus Methylacidiphilales bacterium]
MNLRLIGIALVLAFLGAAQSKAQVIYPADNGFESPNLGSGSGAYEYAPAGTPWTFTATSGIAANNSAFDVFGATQGEASDSAVSASGQAAFLQSTSSISQSVHLLAGDYTVTFDAEGRGGPFFPFNPNEITVSLGGIQLFDATPTQGSFQSYTTTATGFLAAGNYNLTFNGLINGDYTSFIDNVQINLAPTPEPSGAALLILGVLAVIAFRRFHHRASI